ncbi:MAG: SDR family NAD(P)-dependent oxidoreductase [Sporocytophaga sp.]|nr:SDR family NAD(P)-dependent oxidoreductase [Sporocytophaga sp.]
MKELYNRSRLNEICIHFFSSVLEEVDIDAGTDLKLLGIGSVVYSELSVYLNRDYNIQSNPSRFFGLSTINDITTYLLMELGYEEKEVEIALRSLESKAAMQGTEEDIAIIAVSFRVPGAATEEDLWNILSEGKSFISETPQNRWTWPSWIDVTTTHKGINKGGYIKEIDAFDASFFRISPREAELMDPQQRILLELSWELFEKSGYKASSLKGTKTGVYIGASGTDYELLLQERLRKETLTGTGTSVALLPNRISYFFDFDGPSMLIDTACSSSLVAIHEAVKSIRSGDCTQAIVGAVHLMCHPMRSVAYYDSNMLSKDGKCHTFDEKANGYVRGEGAVLMFLKPLTDAVKQGNHIAGVIKGTAVNHGGLSGGLTVPNPEKQRKLIEDSYNNAGIDIKSVSYIEAHGTGTILGDPIEITGLTAAFKNLQSSSENPKPKAGRSKKMNAVKAWCGLGSIKSNIGHLEAASGMAGMLKVLLSMKHSSLPPTINYNNLNTKIELQGSPFYIQSELQSWRSPIKDLLRAGVSSFGIGGANGHVVLESFTKEQKACVNEEGKSGPYLFVLSAKNSDRLKAYTEKFAEFIKQNPTTDHAALCYSLQMTREEMEERLAFVYQHTDDLKEILTKYCKGITSENIYLGNSKNRSKINKVTDAREATVNSWLTDKDLNNLAKYWCAGLPVDWNILYSNEAPDWVELPTYPFARDRYWIPSEENLKETALNSGNQTNAASSRLYVYNNLWQLRSLSVDSVSPLQSNRLILLAAGSADLADKLQERLAIEVESLNKEQESSYFMAVFERVKAKILEKKPVEIIVVYRNDEYLDYGFVSGLLKTSALENPKITGKVLGVDKLSLDSLVDIADILEAELNSQDVEVRYFNGRREAKAVSPVSEVPMAPGTGFKEGGVYLITGGAGGLGFIYASHISKIKDSKVILIGRSMLSQEKQTLIKSLTNAVYYRCDICNREEVDSLVATIQQTYGKLDGVIHAAGVLRDSLILKKIKVEIDEVLLPKIQGVKNLDEATKEEKLDFMVFFSSMTAVLGNIGQGDYASANVYLDNYAEYREREREKGNRHGKTISINWPLWEDGGMKVDAESRRYLEQQWGMLALPVTEGVKILEDFLKGVSGQKIVTYGNESDINLKLCGKRSGLSVDISNEVDTEILKEGLIKKLLEFVSLLLKVTTHDLETDEKFGDYGFNSILLTKLSNEINEYYGLELSPAIFYNYPTIKDLAAFLMEDFQAKIIKCHVSISKPADKIEDIYQKTEFLRGGTSISSIHSKEPLLGSDYNEPIAIIGVNGRFPGSPDLNTFWENIKENKDLITEIPSDRWDWRTYYGDPKKDKNKTKAKWGGFIEDIDKFDPLFFNISPREAELIDPQQRIALEAVYHALEDAGINVKELSGSNTGVFIGTYFDDYTSLIQRNHLNREAQSVTGMFQSILTNRISYLFNLHGPSEPIDTACSSSLVAIHRGVEQIRNGSCNLVIAGGVCLDIIPETLFPMTQAGMLSEDGRCRTFDHRANGYVRGEGVGIIILKALSQAEKDGDIIYGVIRGTAVNHGGKANTLTSPNPNAQKSLLVKAYTSANIDPRDVSYIEAHGTGTPIGDPIEIEGLKLAFKELYQKRNLVPSNEPYCALASVKTNIGHLEAAAGIAGVVKVLLSLKHGILPGNPHLEKPNEYLKLSDSPFYLQKRIQ